MSSCRSDLSGLVPLEGQVAYTTPLLQDREGTVWAGLYNGIGRNPVRLCAIRDDAAQCYGQDGAFGNFDWSLSEDNSGTLWTGAETGLSRRECPPQRHAVPGMILTDPTISPDGQLLARIKGRGLRQLAADELAPDPIRSAIHPNVLQPDRDLDANQLTVSAANACNTTAKNLHPTQNSAGKV